MSDEERNDEAAELEPGNEDDPGGPGGGRRHRIYFQVMDQANGQETDSSNEMDQSDSFEENESETDEDNTGVQTEGEMEEFDTSLPTHHSYLGEAHELSGRTILEEDLIQELVIVVSPGFILMPGQTMPMTIFRPDNMTVMKRLIDTTKTFGSLHMSGYHDEPVEATVGTTAEIYEFREPPEDSNEVGLKLKVKGRQRFRLLRSRVQIDGVRIGTVKILKETELGDPFSFVRLHSWDRFRLCPDEEEEEQARSQEQQQQCSRKESIKEGLAEFLARLKPKNKQKEQVQSNKTLFLPHVVDFRKSKHNHLRSRYSSAPLTPFPYWVYEQYHSHILVQRIHESLTQLRLFSQSKVTIPKDPGQLSFWIGINLPLDDAHRLKILEFNSSIQRLRYELSILEKCQILCCKFCRDELGRQEDIFSMSQEGPQGAYVNPGGYVHETLTLYKAKNLNLSGSSSTEYSWFPGYAWTIANCRNCGCHIGWKFTSTNRKLVPKKFWGISRRSIKPLMELEGRVEEESSESRPVF